MDRTVGVEEVAPACALYVGRLTVNAVNIASNNAIPKDMFLKILLSPFVKIYNYFSCKYIPNFFILYLNILLVVFRICAALVCTPFAF